MNFTEAHAFNLAVRRLALRHRARAHELLAPLGLRPGQEFLLLELADRGGRGQADLADALACAPPSISLMVGKLEAAGLLTRARNPRDQRSVVVDLTPLGRDVADRLQVLWTALATETLGEAGGATAGQVTGRLDAMAGNLKPAAGETISGG